MEVDYYSFGAPMPGRKYTSSSSYRYGFNGKENDPETGTIDFGDRIYDTRIARWLAVDMAAKNAPTWSPYRFGFDNPILYKDPNGQWEEDGHFWTVYAMGISMGLNKITAFRIAMLAESPDHIVHSDYSMSIRSHKSGISWGKDGGLGTWADDDLQLDWHGLTGGFQKHVNTRAKSFILKGDLTYLHLLGDSWAHSYINESGQRVMYGQHGNNEPFLAPIYRFFLGDITFEHMEGGPGHGKIADNISQRPAEYHSYVTDLINIFNNDKFIGHSLIKNMNPDRTIFDYVQSLGGDKNMNVFLFKSFVNLNTGEKNFDKLSEDNYKAWTGYLDKKGIKYTVETLRNRQITGLGKDDYYEYNTYNVKIDESKPK